MLGANCACSCADATTWLETPRRFRPSSIRCWNARGSSRSSSPALSSSTRGSSSPFTATSTPVSTATSLATTSAKGDSWGEIDSIRHFSPQSSGLIYCKQHCCWDVETLLRSRFIFCDGISAVLTAALCFQSVWEDSLFMESSLCSSDRLLEPSLPTRTQPESGAAPAIYRPPLFQVGNHKKGQYGVETVAMFAFPVVNHHQCHQRKKLWSSVWNFCFPCRFWRGLYNRFDRGMHPRQSVEDYLSAIKEETQQLEEQLASHKLVRQN